MSKWKIEEIDDDVLIVRMLSNPVNKQNPDFFKDLQRCFDILDRDYPGRPIVLTGNDKVFSAGLDFDYSFKLFASKDLNRIQEWFDKFSSAILRVFKSDRLTVAAINGHCFAGGLILALCCDFRLGVFGNSKYSLNEVPIGIPMPGSYTEIIRYRIGEKNASDTILEGAVYDVDEAKHLDFIHQIVDPAQLIDSAVKQARCISKVAWPAYIHSKKILRAPSLERIEKIARPFDMRETLPILCNDASIQAQKIAYAKLKS